MTFYQITCDNQIIYDPRSEDKKVIDPKLNLEVKKNGSLSFIIPANNPGYNLISLRKSVIKVYQITKKSNIFLSERLFRGCVYSSNKDFYKRKQVEVEGELSFFNDSVVRPYVFQGSVRDYFYKLVNDHNAQVDQFKRFVPRNCTVVDNNDYITRSNENYPSTKEEMEDKLLNLLGGHFETEEIGNVVYIDYLAEYDKYNLQPIVFGRNLLDLSEVISAEDIKTRLIGLGAKDEETGEYLKFDSINDGKDYVEDAAAISLFGICAGTVEFEDVTIDTNLLAKTRSELEKKITTTTTIDLKAADLHNLDVDIEALRCGKMTQIISIPHGLNKYFLLSKLSVKLDDPKSADIIFGATYKTLTEKQIKQEKALNSNIVTINQSNESIKNEIKVVKQTAQTAKTTADNTKNELDEFIVAVPTTMDFDNFRQEITQKVASIYRICGSVANYNVLVAKVGVEVGDVYNVLDTGANYVYTSDGWDKLSETIDLSPYLLLTVADGRYVKIAVLQDYLTTADAELEYTKISDFDDLVRRVKDLEDNNGGGNS